MSEAFSGIFERGDRKSNSLHFDGIGVLFGRPVVLVGVIKILYDKTLKFPIITLNLNLIPMHPFHWGIVELHTSGKVV